MCNQDGGRKIPKSDVVVWHDSVNHHNCVSLGRHSYLIMKRRVRRECERSESGGKHTLEEALVGWAIGDGWSELATRGHGHDTLRRSAYRLERFCHEASRAWAWLMSRVKEGRKKKRIGCESLGKFFEKIVVEALWRYPPNGSCADGHHWTAGGEEVGGSPIKMTGYKACSPLYPRHTSPRCNATDERCSLFPCHPRCFLQVLKVALHDLSGESSRLAMPHSPRPPLYLIR
ncbi:hypothetical protein GQ53DRAFT_339389 [Thozetella sp. PMI_491]|nr:hypothetical protein GQ53DRAFT_339389 [Thozetella sp. PMI_491]